jgi:hypothetical protein
VDSAARTKKRQSYSGNRKQFTHRNTPHTKHAGKVESCSMTSIKFKIAPLVESCLAGPDEIHDLLLNSHAFEDSSFSRK